METVKKIEEYFFGGIEMETLSKVLAIFPATLLVVSIGWVLFVFAKSVLY